MELDEIKAEAARLSAFAHIATIDADGKPHVSPVMPAWDGDTLWFMSFAQSAKVRNIAANPNVAVHFQVDDSGDGVALWGTATLHSDIETKRRLWKGLLPYDLDEFVPEGPESPESCFVAFVPDRALALKHYGMAGRGTWRRS